MQKYAEKACAACLFCRIFIYELEIEYRGFVFSTFGSGVSGILDSGEKITLSAILTPQIITGLIGLALLALLPVVVKRFKK